MLICHTTYYNAYPLPRVHHILDQLREARYISSLDLKDGYWQIPMENTSRPLTAITVPGKGLFQWKVIYLDDIIVIGRTRQEHMDNLREVFRRLRAANSKININKCDFFKELKYLGHKVTEDGICTDPDFAATVHPINALLEKGTKWEWMDGQLTESPVLACSDFSKPLCL
ncbi:hypothetical protein AWZ03_015378 [Drosophila navojoa]|uniref:Reverse transcriptase domain-containing protein n=1 Tax=Drosophila navojoa TaxID=7232 RepID=A0A484AQH9_DRONA|nr:hypothetical protein AWZ03_015378 [Drosophila navojoa]